MSVTFPTTFTHVPYPDPIAGFLFSPEGRWTGRAAIVGNATGGTALVLAQTDRAGEFLYLLDAFAAESSTGDSGEGVVTFRQFLGDHISSLDAGYRLIGSFTTGQGRRYTLDEHRPPNMLLGVQRPEVGALNTILSFNWENNLDTLVYAITFSGRYYRRSLISEPGFLRVVLGRG